MKNESEIDSREFVRGLRADSTDAERLLWFYLRNRRLDGFKFRRQQPLGAFVVDFVCFEHKLIVEADGGQHAEQRQYDEARTDYLRNCGYRVLRFWNREILIETAAVLAAILAALREPLDASSSSAQARTGEGDLTPHPNPLPQGERG